VTLTAANAEPLDPHPVLVVIPTYNERENITGLVREIMAQGDQYQVLVVDDSSPDGTADLVRQLMVEFPDRVDLLLRSTKEGIGRAYVAGFKHALARGNLLIAQMDADHSHQPSDLPRLVERAANADLVLASRYMPGGKTVGWPWHRKLISRFGGVYAGVILRVPIRDLTGGFKVWHADVLRSIELDSIHSDGYCFQIETTYRALRKKATYAQVPITFTDRVAGKSKLSRRVVFEAMVIPWNLRFRQLMRRPW
jgi:dolichol-phosphate mannosyltransferase